MPRNGIQPPIPKSAARGWPYLTCAVLLGLLAAASAAAGELGEQEARGKRIYTTGEGSGSIAARLIGPGIDAPATNFPCIQCHKEGGEGGREGGVFAPEISYRLLTLEHSGVRKTGRDHPPYDDASLARAILQGQDPAGNALHPAMPRYTMNEGDLAGLIAYLKVLGKEPVPGVGEGSVRVAILKPVSGPLAPAGQAVAAFLAAYFKELNALGGVYGRQVQLVAVEFDPAAQPEAMAASVRRHLDEAPVFCFIANLGVPEEHPVSRLLAEEGIPVFAPLTLHAANTADPGTFYIQASLYDQARVLVDHLNGKRPGGMKRIALVYSADAYGQGAAAGARVQAGRHGMSVVSDLKYPPGAWNAEETAERLKASNAEAVFFFGPGGDMRSLIDRNAALAWPVPVLGLAELAGEQVLSLPAASSGLVFLASPLSPPEASHEGTTVYYRLLKKYDVPGRYFSFLSSAFAGTRLMEEGMRRAGRAMTRASLIETVGGLWQFETGVMPRLTYNQNRRTGLTGAAVLGVDPEKKQFLAIQEWREPEGD